MPPSLGSEVDIKDVRQAFWLEKKRRAEEHLRDFVEQAWHVLEPGTPFVPGIHVDAICLHLEALLDGRIKNLIINIPPGFAKSLLSGVFFPAWVWIRWPECRFLFSSYNSDYAIRDSVKCRELIQSDWYQERWRDKFSLSSVVNAKERFANNKQGVRATCAALGGTGDRGNITLVDDPMSVVQAASDAKRKAANDWWTGTMATRLNDLRTDHLVVVQQRLHEEDTTGVCLRLGTYVHLYLPNEFEVDRACATPIGWKDPRTKEGQLLWPMKVGPKEIADLKLTLGSYGYAGQYQQRPSPAGGGIFKKWWWRYWKPKYMDLPPVQVRDQNGKLINIHPINLPDEFDQELQSWDMSFKDLDSSDYVAGGHWATRKADRFLMDQKRERLGFPETVQAVRAMRTKWPKARTTLVEDKANGTAVLQTLRREIPGLIGVEPQGGKIARAQACSPQVESGNVYLPHPTIAPWVEAFVEECASFPNGKYDDQVDQMTQALNRLSGSINLTKSPLPAPQIPSGGRSWMS